jgi:hypothetical protein
MDFENAGREPLDEDLVRGLRLAHWRAFFGLGDTYYTEQLLRLEAGRRLKFNWYAFLFGYYWMMYRQLYLVALAVFLTWLVLETLIVAVGYLLPEPLAPVLTILVAIVVRVLYGVYATRVYFWYAERRIRTALDRGPMTEAMLIERLREQGGTSWPAVIILFLALAVFNMLVKKYAGGLAPLF